MCDTLDWQACPATEMLELLLTGGLTAAEGATLEQHIARCGPCEALLADLSDDPELRGWLSAVDGNHRSHAPLPSRWADGLGRLPPGPDAALGFLGPPRRDGDLGSLGPYRIEAELGRGGMGIVLRAYDEGLQRTVAVKVLRRELAHPAARQRFVQEARAAAQVRHDHVVTVFAVANPADGVPYFAMELLAGSSLAALIRGGGLTPERAALLVAQAADGLAAAHAAGLVHRDVKPSNILLDPAADRAKVSDFGLACQRDASADGARLTQDGAILGTPAYMGPEQLLGAAVDARADVYGLGVTLYEALTGEVPFRGVTHLVLDKVLHEDPTPPRRLNDRIPRDLETICLKAMAKEPARRYASAAELAADLRRFLGGEPIRARPAGAIERRWRWCRRNRGVALLSASLLSLLALLAVGSTLAAVVVAQARDEAERRQQDAEQAARDAHAAEARAAASARAAEDHFGLACDTIDTLVVRVQGQLEQGGTLTLRRELLATALKGLEKIAQSAEKTAATDLRRVEVHERLGHLFFRLGDRPRARHEFERGREVAEALLRGEADNLALRLRLANVLEMLGNVALYAGDHPGAAARYGDAIRAYDAIVRLEPTNAQAQFALAQLAARLGDVRFHDRDLPAAQTLYEQALALLQARTWPDALAQHIRYALGYDYERLGSVAVERRDLSTALHQFQKALSYRGEYLERDRTPNAQLRYAETCVTVGEIQLGLADRAAGVGALRKAVASLEPVYQTNPDDAEVTATLGAALSSFGFGLYLSGEPAAARTAASRALSLLDKRRLDLRASSERSALDRAARTLTRIEEDAGRYAEAAGWLDRVLRSLPGGDHGAIKQQTKEYERQRAVYQAAARLGLAEPKQWAAEPSPVRAGLLRLRALLLARQGEHTAAAATAAELMALPRPGDEARLAVARVYARCAATLAAQPLPLSDADRRLHDRYEAEAARAWRACLDRPGDCQLEARLHPDLEHVRAAGMPAKARGRAD